MRFHTNILTHTDLRYALRFAADKVPGTDFLDYQRPALHGSRSRNHAFEIRLEGDGTATRRRVNPGRSGDYSDLPFAAGWDAWGWLISYLYVIDPLMRSYAYENADSFRERTNGAFRLDVDTRNAIIAQHKAA